MQEQRARLRANIEQPSDADIASFYQAHPQLFARRRIYALMQTRIAAGPERSAELAGILVNAMTDDGAPGAFFDWLMDHGIAYSSSNATVPAEDIPSDLLAALQHATKGAAFIIDLPSGPTMLQIADINDQPVTLAQSQASIAAFLINARLDDLMKQG